MVSSTLGAPTNQDLEQLKNLTGELMIADGKTLELTQEDPENPSPTVSIRLFWEKTPEEGKRLQAEYEKLANAVMKRGNFCNPASEDFYQRVAPENRKFQQFAKQNKSCQLRRADRKNDRLILTPGTRLIFSPGNGDGNEGYAKAVKAVAKDGRSVDLHFFCFEDGRLASVEGINQTLHHYGIEGSLVTKSKSAPATKPTQEKKAGAR